MLAFLEKIGLGKLENALIYGLVIAAVLAILANTLALGDMNWWRFVVRWLHVASGVMWIGLLWYFNFVQIPEMAKIPNELKPAVSKHIAPTALFWFRWAALSTLVFGLILAWMNGYIVQALGLGIWGGGRLATMIGIGMWLGIIMAYNVWMIIWPNQQKALGLVDATAEEKPIAAKTAMITSRFNTMFSIPMLYFMVAAQNL